MMFGANTVVENMDQYFLSIFRLALMNVFIICSQNKVIFSMNSITDMTHTKLIRLNTLCYYISKNVFPT